MPNFPTTSGTKALTQNAEWSVAQNAAFNAATPKTTSGYVTVWLDLRTAVGGGAGLVAGDTVQIRIYRSIGGGTLAPDDVVTPVIGGIWTRNLGLVGGNWEVTVTLTTATGRTIGFEVVQDINDVNALTLGAAAVTSIWSSISEGAETVGDTIRLIASRLFGKATVQDGDGAYTYRDGADSKNRIAMTRTGTARTVSTRDGT